MNWSQKRWRLLGIKVGFLSLLFCILISGEKANAATDIRVGLKSLYMGKSIITIYNTKLSMGYCIDDSYTADLELKSTGGFSFEPENGEYYTDSAEYRSYSEAVKAVNSLSGKKG